MLNYQRVAEPLFEGVTFWVKVNEPIQDPPQVIRVPTPGAPHIVKRRAGAAVDIGGSILKRLAEVKKIGKYPLVI